MNNSDHMERVDRLDTALHQLKLAAMNSRDHLTGGLTMTRTQLEILHRLKQQPGQTVGELARAIFLTQSAVTQTVDTLVHRELVERRPSERDRRTTQLHLTAAGEAVMDRLRQFRRERIEALASVLTDAEIDALVTATGKMARFATDQKENEGS
jgi:DNA-binding MarR family transcriptional regulator